MHHFLNERIFVVFGIGMRLGVKNDQIGGAGWYRLALIFEN